jgi:hypothetical protein
MHRTFRSRQMSQVCRSFGVTTLDKRLICSGFQGGIKSHDALDERVELQCVMDRVSQNASQSNGCRTVFSFVI